MKTGRSSEVLKPIIERPNPVPPGLEGLEQIAWLMDRAFKIPGTPIRVGLDSILGLLPVGGDVLTGLVQAGIVVVAMVRYRVPKPIAARMAANVLLDIALGSIPIVGDVFDTFFKANTRNLRLLTDVAQKQIAHRPVETSSSIFYLVAIAATMFGFLALVLIGFITAVAWVYHRLSM